MTESVFPTKGNLISVKKSLQLARTGYELLDRKRNILIREMMQLISTASEVQQKIDETFHAAYISLQKANITIGVIQEISAAFPIEESVEIEFRSVMGVEIPIVHMEESVPFIHYGFSSSNSTVDEAYISFLEVKRLTAALAEIENSVYRLAYAITKTQKRANALKNINIPKFESQVKFIENYLEEKDREDFSRLKMIKQIRGKQRTQAGQDGSPG